MKRNRKYTHAHAHAHTHTHTHTQSWLIIHSNCAPLSHYEHWVNECWVFVSREHIGLGSYEPLVICRQICTWIHKLWKLIVLHSHTQYTYTHTCIHISKAYINTFNFQSSTARFILALSFWQWEIWLWLFTVYLLICSALIYKQGGFIIHNPYPYEKYIQKLEYLYRVF